MGRVLGSGTVKAAAPTRDPVAGEKHHRSTVPVECWVEETFALEVRSPMDALTERRELTDDLDSLGHAATAAHVRKALARFMAWKLEAGERLLERALEERRRHEHGLSKSIYFNTCALAVL